MMVGVREISDRGRGEVGRGMLGSFSFLGDCSWNMILISLFHEESVLLKGLAAGRGDNILTLPAALIFFSGVLGGDSLLGGENIKFLMCGEGGIGRTDFFFLEASCDFLLASSFA